MSRLKLVHILLTITLPLAVSCSGESDETQDTSSCESDNDCSGDLLCVGSTCVTPEQTGDTMNMGGGEGGSTTMLDCSKECPDKLTTCGFPMEYIELCSDVCPDLPQTELQCFVSASCEDLANADDSITSFCELTGGGTGGGGTGGGTGGGGTGNNNPDMGGNGGGGSQCETTTPTCDGDTLVTCDDSAGFPLTERKTCSRGCENGACVGAVDKTTLRANLKVVDEPICVGEPGEITCITSASGNVSSDPDMLIGNLKFQGQDTPHTLKSPSADDCDYGLNLVMNRSEITMQLSGVDEGATTACYRFLDKVGKNGIHIQLSNVEELNSSNVLSTVDIIVD